MDTDEGQDMSQVSGETLVRSCPGPVGTVALGGRRVKALCPGWGWCNRESQDGVFASTSSGIS